MTEQRLDTIDARTWRLCWVIVLGAFASGLDASIVTVGLDSITRDLDSSLSTTQWVASGYVLALAVSLPLAGWLGRRCGSGRLWLCSLAAFTAASALCAAAPTVELLIAARVIQGLAGGVLIPTGQTVLGDAVGPSRLGRVMGTLGVAVSAAPAIGPLLGGALLHITTWPWLFAVNIPIGMIGLALGYRLVPRGTPGPATPLHRQGLALISIGLPSLVFATTRWGDAGRITSETIVAAAVAAGALGGFVVATNRTAHPLLDLSLYRLPAFRAGTVTALFSGALVFASGIVFVLHFQLGKDQNPLETGISLLGVAGATAAAAPLTGRWIDRCGPAPAALTGGALALTTTAAVLFVPLHSPWFVLQPVLLVFGASVSMVAMPAGITAYKAVGPLQLADAITQINIVQRIGGALAGAICAVLIDARDMNSTKPFQPALVALVLSAAGAMVGALLIRRTEREVNSPIK